MNKKQANILNKSKKYKNYSKENLLKSKLPFEIESWVFGYKNEFEKEFLNQEDYDDIEDAYLENFITSSKDNLDKRLNIHDKNQNMLKRKNEIKEILNNIRNTRELKNHGISLKIKGSQSAKNNKCRNKLFIKDSNTKNNHEASIATKFKTISNGMSRAVPGILQKNITVERTFFQDLIKLSKDRYMTKLNMDYQKRFFIAKQHAKGFMINYTSVDSSNLKRGPINSYNKEKPRSKSVIYQNKNDIKIKENRNNRKSLSTLGFRNSNLDNKLIKTNKSSIKKGVFNKTTTLRKQSDQILLSDEDFDERESNSSSLSFYEIKRPSTSLPYFLREKNSIKNEKVNNLKKELNPLHDSRYKKFINSLNTMHLFEKDTEKKKSNDLIGESYVLSCDTNRRRISKNCKDSYLKELEENKKLFEKLVGDFKF